MKRGDDMKIAFPAIEYNLNSIVDIRFGRANQFILYDTESEKFIIIPNIQNIQAAQGAGIQAAQIILNRGAQVLIAKNIGPKAFKVLEAVQIAIYLAQEGTIQENIEYYKQGKLKKTENSNVDGHWV